MAKINLSRFDMAFCDFKDCGLIGSYSNERGGFVQLGKEAKDALTFFQDPAGFKFFTAYWRV
jgi:hypothetical protein